MAVRKRILFIGNIQRNEPPTGGGVQAKNQQIAAYLSGKEDLEVSFVDTYGRSAVNSLITSIRAIISTSRETRIYFSITIRGVIAITSIMEALGIKREMYLFVPGGSVDIPLAKREVRLLGELKCIYVQGRFIQAFYNSFGLNNVEILYNFKAHAYRPTPHNMNRGKLRCVFLGRVFTEKGIDTIVDCFSTLKDIDISIDIYGILHGYTEEYFSSLSNINYCGFMDLTDTKGYDKLAEYDVLVFPTRFEGEGFPGVILDAFISGLAVVTTNFHVNPEVVSDGKNGLIVPVADPKSLAAALRKLYFNPVLLSDMKDIAFKSAQIYTPDNLLKTVF